MKYHARSSFVRILVISIFTLGLTTGCLEQAEEEEASNGGNTPTNKATLSSWATENSAWALRLDLAGANISGTPFTLVVKFADNSETHCSATINGTEASGSYNISSCTTPGTGSMSDSVGDALETGGAGTYVNNGSSFHWCRANTSCFTYY